MKRTILIIILLFTLNNIYSQQLSTKAEVSVLICAKGNDLYSTFGHSAIRINDPINRIDYVYNYGTFNFNTPNFYFKFVRGQLDYMLSVSKYKYFVPAYIQEKRWIKEHILDLTYEQKNEIYSFLYNNSLPENRYYRYDFFYDNCATRVRDVLKTVLKNKLVMPNKPNDEGITFRDLTHIYLKGHDWERFGTNLALGHPTDKVVSMEEATFLPDYLGLALESSRIKINGKRKRLVKKTQMLYEPKNKVPEPKTAFTPLMAFGFLLLIVLLLTYIEYKKNNYFILLDKAILFILGTAGVILLLLWFGTEHTAVANNFNVIWAMPLYFIASFILKSKNQDYLKKFFLIMSIILVLSIFINLTIFWLYDYTIYPLVIILIIRSFLIYKKR